MPVMIRSNKKATNIAFSLIGKPANMQKRSYRKIKRDEQQFNVPIKRNY